MNNVKELREQLSEMFNELRKGQIELPRVAELNNTAGKIMKTAQIQIKYAQMRKEKPTIAFMDEAKECQPQST